LIGFTEVENGPVVDGFAIGGKEVLGWEEIESHGDREPIIFSRAGAEEFTSRCVRR